jgi:hypothetical protein
MKKGTIDKIRALCREMERLKDNLRLYENVFDNPAQAKYIKLDRDRLEVRAEALERALRLLGHCESCVHYFPPNGCKSTPTVPGGDCKNYEFDEARFAQGVGI